MAGPWRPSSTSGARARGRVGVQGEQCAPPIEIELSKPNPTAT